MQQDCDLFLPVGCILWNDFAIWSYAIMLDETVTAFFSFVISHFLLNVLLWHVNIE